MPAEARGGDAVFLYTAAPAARGISGAQSAETGLLHALAAPGVLDRLRVFARDPLPGLPAHVEQLPLAAMPESLARDPPEYGLVPFALAAQLAYLRDRGPRPFPLLGYVHSLATLEVKQGLARTMRSPWHGNDVALCASPAAAQALGSILDEIEEDFAGLPLVRPQLAPCPIGIDPAECNSVDRAAARAAFGLGDSTIAFAVVGRLSPASKMDLAPLLLALAGVRSRAPIVLLIAGQEQFAGYRALLQARAAELGIAARVRFVEDDSRAAILTVFAAADVFLAPSDNPQESFGIALVEALAHGLPVIASDWNGYRGVLAQTGAALLIPTLAAPPDPAAAAAAFYRGPRAIALHLAQTVAVDVAALRRAIAALADDPARRVAMGAAARAAARDYAWPKVVARIRTLAAEAARAPVRSPAAGIGTYRLDWARHFGHYPSTLLDRQRLRGSAAPAPGALIDWLADKAGLDPAAIATLRAEAADRRPIRLDPADGARTRAAAFLLKQGILEVEGEEG